MAYNPITSNTTGAYMVSYITVSAATPVAVAGTFVKALGTTAIEISRGITMPSNNRYTIATAGIYQVNVVATMTTTANNRTLAIQLYKNGLPIVSTIQQDRADNTPNPVSIPTTCIFSAVAGDYIEVWLTNVSNNEAVTMTRLTININELYSA
jgi:hypothetical protein